MDHIRAAFTLAPDAEIAIELDPRNLSADRLKALHEIGINRASLGVQDFDPAVQRAVGRIQSFETTAKVAQSLRNQGIQNLNLDLMYGLPYQTETSVTATAFKALELKPDRIAVFGYAHVPWMKRHQKLMPESQLPNPLARFAQREAIAAVLLSEGYQAIGLDHFALPTDSLSIAATQKTLHRNFQGYTTDAAPALLGFGASSISSLPQGYAQNETSVPTYRAAVAEGFLPIHHGVALTADDILRRDIIQTLMCDFEIDLIDTAMAHHADPAQLLAAAPRLEILRKDGLISWNGRHITVTRAGQPLVRSIAAIFDAYLTQNGAQRHAQAV